MHFIRPLNAVLGIFFSLIILMPFALTNYLQAKHVMPHYDITPKLTKHEIIEHAEMLNDETLIVDTTKKMLLENYKKSLQKIPKPFQMFLIQLIQNPGELVDTALQDVLQ